MPVDHGSLRAVLARFAGTLVRRYDLQVVLQELSKEVCAILGVSGAGVMLGDPDGHLRFTSTSDNTLDQLERLQIALGEGPCVMAFQRGEAVVAADLAADERFPEFGPRAVRSGMRAICSLPLQHGDQTIGAVNLYRAGPGPFDREEVEVGQLLADVATSYLMHAQEVEQAERLNRQLAEALESRVSIEQAKGFLGAALGLDMDASFAMLRRYARSNSRGLHAVSREVVAGELEPAQLAGQSDGRVVAASDRR